ncbi:MAG TPA: hypothetical protein VGF86_05320 [Candidatus Tumulicola sp.]|jgi:hypothetical protein
MTLELRAGPYAFALLLAAVLGRPAAAPAAVDFQNFDYAQVPCSANVPAPAVVRKGVYSYFDKEQGTGFDVAVKSVTPGSLHPGTHQAVVILACHFPSGGVAGAYVYNVHPNAAVLLGSVGGASWGGDWGSGPSSIHVRFAKQFLYVDTCSNQNCTTREVRTYALRAGKLVKVYVLSHKVR